MTRARLLVFAWLGLTLILCLGDNFFHVRTGILHYAWRPLVDGQSVWVWLVFSVAAAAMIGLSLFFPLRDVPADVPWASIGVSTAVFIAVYWLTGQIGESHPTALFAGLTAAWLLRVLVRRGDRSMYIAHGVVLAVLGVVGEGLFSMAGLFAYDLQQVVDCPWWLAGFYLHASIALLQVARGARVLAVDQRDAA